MTMMKRIRRWWTKITKKNIYTDSTIELYVFEREAYIHIYIYEYVKKIMPIANKYMYEHKKRRK